MKKNVIKFSVLTLSVMLMFLCLTTITNVKAMSYNYDYFKNVVPSAEGLAYDSTYYSINIKPADGVSTETVPMDGLKDMEVYDGKIYILNTTVSQQIELHAATADREAIKVDWKNMGQIAVINENLTDEVIVTVIATGFDKNKEKEQIMSIRDLASNLGINPNTVKKAYTILENKGIITSISTKGTFINVNASKVKNETINNYINEIKSIIEKLSKLGLTKEEIIKKLN